MIQPRSAVRVVAERPALRVDHAARAVQCGVDIPQFLDADAVDLRLRVLRQVERADRLLGQEAAHALAQEGVFGVDLEPGRVVGLVRAVARDPHVAGRDALHRSVLVVEHFGRGETGEDLDPQFLGLARQPAAQVGEAAGIRPLVVQERRHDPVR